MKFSNNNLLRRSVAAVLMIGMINTSYTPASCATDSNTGYYEVYTSARRYGTYFTAGLSSQLITNQAIGAIKTRWELPGLTPQQTALLTATGQVFSVLPFMFTFTAAANLGLSTVIDTMRGQIEATIRQDVSKKWDYQFSETLPTGTLAEKAKKEETDTKFHYDRKKAHECSKEAAKAVARGSLLARTLVVGATAAAMIGPKIIEQYLFTEPAEKKQTPQAQEKLSPEEEILKIVKELQTKANSSPIAQLINITPEQVSFFAGQLVACAAPNTLGLTYWKKLKKYL